MTNNHARMARRAQHLLCERLREANERTTNWISLPGVSTLLEALLLKQHRVGGKRRKEPRSPAHDGQEDADVLPGCAAPIYVSLRSDFMLF